MWLIDECAAVRFRLNRCQDTTSQVAAHLSEVDSVRGLINGSFGSVSEVPSLLDGGPAMRRVYWFALVAAISLLSVTTCPCPACAQKLGLLIIGHGSASPRWNERFIQFGQLVAQQPEIRETFHATTTAFMEFARPSIRDGVTALEQAGCERIIAVPVFVSVGHHTLFDVPAALGIYHSPECIQHLAEHGGEAASPNVPIVYTATPDGGNLLLEFAVTQLRQLSTEPKDEGVVILIHGDAAVRPMLENLLRRVVAYSAAQTGIACFEWAYVGVGQGFKYHGLRAIEEVAAQKSRVLVIGLYLGLSAQAIVERALTNDPDLAEVLNKKQVIFAKDSLMDYPPMLRWVVETAVHAASH